MNDIVPVQIGITDNNLLHELNCFEFGETLFLLDYFGKVASFAELGYDISIVLGVVNIE